MGKIKFLTINEDEIDDLRHIVLDYEKNNKNSIYLDFETIKLDIPIYVDSKNNVYNYIKHNYNKNEGNVLELMFSYDDILMNQIMYLQVNLPDYQKNDYYKPILKDLEIIVLMLSYLKQVEKIVSSIIKTGKKGSNDDVFMEFLKKFGEKYNIV